MIMLAYRRHYYAMGPTEMDYLPLTESKLWSRRLFNYLVYMLYTVKVYIIFSDKRAYPPLLFYLHPFYQFD